MERYGVQTPIRFPTESLLSSPPHQSNLPSREISHQAEDCKKTEVSTWLPGKVTLLVTRTRTLPLSNHGLLGCPSIMERGICTKVSLYLRIFYRSPERVTNLPDLPKAVLVLKHQVPCELLLEPKNLCGTQKTRMVGHLVS